VIKVEEDVVISVVLGPHLYNKTGNKTRPLKSPSRTIPRYILK